MSNTLNIIKAKWHFFLPPFFFWILFANKTIQDCLQDIPTISIISSACWLVTFTIMFIDYFQDILEQEIDKKSKQPIESSKYLIDFKDFNSQNIIEKVLAILTSIFVFVFCLLLLLTSLNSSNSIERIFNSDYLLFNEGGNIIIYFSLSLVFLIKILKIKSKLILSIGLLLGICGFVIMSMSANYVS